MCSWGVSTLFWPSRSGGYSRDYVSYKTRTSTGTGHSSYHRYGRPAPLTYHIRACEPTLSREYSGYTAHRPVYTTPPPPRHHSRRHSSSSSSNKNDLRTSTRAFHEPVAEKPAKKVHWADKVDVRGVEAVPASTPAPTGWEDEKDYSRSSSYKYSRHASRGGKSKHGSSKGDGYSYDRDNCYDDGRYYYGSGSGSGRHPYDSSPRVATQYRRVSVYTYSTYDDDGGGEELHRRARKHNREGRAGRRSWS